MRRPKQLTESRPMAAKVLTLLLLLCASAVAQETAPISALEVKYRKQIFKNDRFSVFLLEIPPRHASLMHRHDTDMLSIFVAGGETKGTIYGRPPKEDRFAVGEVRFRPAGFTHSTENIGANVFRSVILEFNSSAGAIQPAKPPDSSYCNPGSETACASEKYLLCTVKFCAKEVSLAPRAIWRDSGSAGDRLLVAVSDYELSLKPEGKAARVLKRKSGEVEHFTGGSGGQWTNAASRPARIIAVEFR